MATYVGDLITEVRRDTENTDFSTTQGIDTEDFLRYMNYGLHRLQGLLISNNITMFRRREDISIVADQANYSISDNVYLGESIVDVQYSSTGNETDYRELREIAESYRNYDTASHLRAFSRRAGSLFVSPVPSQSQGVLRVTYERAVDRLDLRRGQIDAVTSAGNALTVDTVSLDIADDDPDRINGVTDMYFNIVDKDGGVVGYNVNYTAYDDVTTGDFTHEGKTDLLVAAAQINDYVTIGKYSTTHLTDINAPDVERYLQLYCALKIFRRDSSNDAKEASKELNAIEKEIVESYQGIMKDEQNIQINDPNLLYLGSRGHGW